MVRGVTRTRVDNDIRHWARRRVTESQREIDAQRRQAMREGYRDGIAAALEDVVAHLMRTEALCEQWRAGMIGQMRELLGAATQHPEALLAALDDAMHTFVDKAGMPSDVPITVVMPVRLKARREDIRARIEAVCRAPLTLEFRAKGEGISVQRAGTAIEYDPQNYAARAEAALDIDPRVPRADLHTLLASALASLNERLDELNALNTLNTPNAVMAISTPTAMEDEDDERY
ncbi:Oxygen-regulated invasion protein OrgB [Pandoraea capi]|uniref:Oxygen-regulated invasion protein OrgB n=1 Tax=Pandoraea capi TaxID=2508286 RepID=A0ABY6VX00_9BURK|nr:Oxygen-regulated invasion protein OrgB [Pandoraea capi]